MEEYFKTNEKLWDQKTGVHKDSAFYDLKGFKQGKTSLQEIELNALSAHVADKSLLHLQCHFGQDSLSFARMGAKVTGVDLSPNSIQLARELNVELGLDAQFIVSNIYGLDEHIDKKFDIVFTSYGVLTWLPDLDKWAAIVAKTLKSGGTFYIAEFHPVFYMFDHDTGKIAYRYFNHKKPYEEVEVGTYADESAKISLKEYFWCHDLGEIINALLHQGLILTDFQEFPFSPYPCFPNMTEVSLGRFVYGDLINRIPHVFSLKMTKK